MADLVGRFKVFLKDFSDLFFVYRKDRIQIAQQYLSGLMQVTDRKNMEQISLAVPDSDHQAIQQFITDTDWDAQSVMDRVAENVNELIGDPQESCLIIDESGFRKKGTKSVGVARQWLGNIGKVDNCQIGVYAALCKGDKVALINSKLYLPQEWTQDRARCEEAKIPLDDRDFKTKDDIALEFVDRADVLGIDYSFVCADAGYGKGFSFCEELRKRDKVFMVDIHSDTMVYLNNPKPYIPTDSPGRGRKHSRQVSNKKAIRVDELIAGIPESEWEIMKVRKSTKGSIKYEYAHKRVWIWIKNSGVYQWHLIVRRNAEDKNDYKYSLSNADEKTTTRKLASMQAQRFWIERAFEDYKGSCGMKDYEVRSWNGWHHHMALVMMAGLFVLSEKLNSEKDDLSLTYADVEYLLQRFLPKRIVTDEDVIAELYRRIKFRGLLYSQGYN
jgi:SRSO17 transposase